MTYLWKGEQYVAIGAGGHSEAGTTIGDSVVAFRLPRQGEGAFAEVAHHRSARRTIPEWSDRGRVRGSGVAVRILALAKIAPRKLIDRSGADPSALAVPDVSFTTSVGELR